MELSVEQALRNASMKERSHWPPRGQTNRVEPACWPVLRPSFYLTPGSSVFTLGNCFARNIEQVLRDLGFRVPVLDFCAQHPQLFSRHLGVRILNRYTPPSIFQELAWVRRILDRDGKVKAEDVEPYLLDAGSGRVVDSWRINGNQFGMTKEEAFRERELIYDLFREAFVAETIIITLGRTECWFDPVTTSYVQLNRVIASDADRFRFRCLDFQDALDFTRRSIELLRRDRHVPVLLTLSPIPMMKTYTNDDVIVANMQSKSILRAVAGEISATMEDVDYLPSYESVMLTRDNRIWSDDLVHVDPAFVGSVMVRVIEAYVPAKAIEQHATVVDLMYQVINAARARRWAEASALTVRLPIDGLPDHPTEYFAVAAEIAASAGDAETTASMASRFDGVLPVDHMRCAKALASVGLADAAGEKRATAIRLALQNHVELRHWLRELNLAGETSDLLQIMHEAETAPEFNAASAATLATFYAELGRHVDEERLLRFAFGSDVRNEPVGLKLARLLFASGRGYEAVGVLRLLRDGGSSSPRLHPLVNDCLQSGKVDEARRLNEELLRASPGHPALLALAEKLKVLATTDRGVTMAEPSRGLSLCAP